MEVLHRHQPVFGSQPAAMVFPTSTATNLSHLPVPPAYMFTSSSPTCYPFQTTPSPYTPSRTPTPEYPRSGSHESNMGVHSTTVLQSVLSGEVPKAYSHFMSPLANQQHRSGSRSPSEAPSSSSPGVFGAGSSSLSPESFRTLSSSSPVGLGVGSLPSMGVFGAASSSSSSLALGGVGSAPVLSPPPEDLQTEPMDLSCKRPSSTSSISSSSSAFHHTLPPSPSEDHQGQAGSFSLLRNLLQVGKPPQPSFSSSLPSSSQSVPSSSSSTSDRSCDSPCLDPCSRAVGRMVRVKLAKSVHQRVSTRVSDWLLKMVHFAKTIPFFNEELSRHDQEVLLLSSWSRLLVLYMAESHLTFEVTPVEEAEESEDGKWGASFNQPTMKSVEELRSFMQKCKELKLEEEEYHYLRLLVLFNHSARTGTKGLQDTSRVDNFNHQVLEALRNHVQGRMGRHCQLLMTLPTVYGFSTSMMDQLFCRNMDLESVTDAASLLVRLLDTIRPSVK